MSAKNCFVTKLKWTIYDWVGAISEDELVLNKRLQEALGGLLRRISQLEDNGDLFSEVK